MCSPTAAITPTQMFALTTAMQVGQSAMQYGQSRSQMNAQNAMNQRLGETNALNSQLAKAAYGDTLEALRSRGLEEQTVLGQQLEQSQKLALATQGRAKVEGAARGLGGKSLAALMREIGGMRDQSQQTLALNDAAIQRQLGREAKGAYATMMGRILGLPMPQPVMAPSLMAHGLSAASGALDAYGKYLYKVPDYSGKKPSSKGVF